MNAFVDIHCHALFGVDDGAPDETTMCEMLRASYADGVRELCLTPHWSFEHMSSEEKVSEAFEKAKQYCRDELPEMVLYLGNELTYRFGGTEMLAAGTCRTLAGTRYVLVDFFSVNSATEILRGIGILQNAGYLPIVAHIERYGCFWKNAKVLNEVVQTGALIQVNVESLRGGLFSAPARIAHRLLAAGLVHVIASDGHDPVKHPPVLSQAYQKIQKRYGEEYATQLFCTNPKKILQGEKLRSNR